MALLWAVDDAPAVTTVTPEGRVTPEGIDTPDGSEMVTAEAPARKEARMTWKYILTGWCWT